MVDLITIGWRERLSLPDLGLDLKAKVDTGARTSALHVAWLQEYTREGRAWVQIAVDTTRGKSALRVCEALAMDRRDVTDSVGHTTARWFIPQHHQHRATPLRCGNKPDRPRQY